MGEAGRPNLAHRLSPAPMLAVDRSSESDLDPFNLSAGEVFGTDLVACVERTLAEISASRSGCSYWR